MKPKARTTCVNPLKSNLVPATPAAPAPRPCAYHSPSGFCLPGSSGVPLRLERLSDLTQLATTARKAHEKPQINQHNHMRGCSRTGAGCGLTLAWYAARSLA
jgi:hypothetical protein